LCFKLIKMKRTIYSIAAILLFASCQQAKKENTIVATYQPDSLEQTNNFYDNGPQFELPTVPLHIDGEIANPGTSDLSKQPLRSVIVKEALLNDDGTNRFVGAYRYDGYSLFDILSTFKIQKKNKEEFNPIIDLYVEVSNDQGEKVVLTWGELYYPNNLHKIIIATKVMRIVPSKTKDLWPLPTTSRLVVGNDLLTERNISNPSKITVRSLDASFKVDRGISPLYFENVKVTDINGKEFDLSKATKGLTKTIYNTIFYGRGRGIHSTSPFTGYQLKDVLAGYYPVSKENIQHGIFTMAALDGYRVAISYAELFNRNDQQEFLLIETSKDEKGGKFRVFPACDFFSDRAVKALSEIRFEKR